MRTAPPIRVRKLRLLGLLVLVAIAATLVLQSASSSPTAPASSRDVVSRAHRDAPRDAGRDLLGVAGGAIPDGTTVLDDTVPGVARLDPALRTALRRAAADAAVDGLELDVNSGWRSAAYQEHLREEAAAEYGSDAEAARWVATPKTSTHVSGDAVDIGPSGAVAWLSAHGAAYGLCQIYDNEPWHFELRPEAAGQGCPARYPDAAHR